ncbi:MAG: hypothetical protein JWO78_1299 [Micavibrio sp.]|nr:hypothetical protein [Micavibrio sp.]
MLFNLGTWISRISEFAGVGEPEDPPPPPVYSFLLRADGAFFLLLSDSTSKMMRP